MNYKRKSRRRFFLLVRSRTPPISSEFRGGGGLNTPNPPPGTPLHTTFRTGRKFEVKNSLSFLAKCCRCRECSSTVKAGRYCRLCSQATFIRTLRFQCHLCLCLACSRSGSHERVTRSVTQCACNVTWNTQQHACAYSSLLLSFHKAREGCTIMMALCLLGGREVWGSLSAQRSCVKLKGVKHFLVFDLLPQNCFLTVETVLTKYV